jgi:hypothetical protein
MSFFLNWEGPALIGGDFNLVRFVEDKNNGNIDLSGLISLMPG